MKYPNLLTTVTIPALALTLLSCTKNAQEKTTDKVAEVYETSKTAVVDTWNNVKEYTYEKQSDFSKRAEAIASDLDAKISKLKTEAAEAKASASHSAAMEELINARTNLGEKLTALGKASADTWANAKSNVITATNRVEAAYDQAVADHT
jgi:hypothetical protein|uniref:hypothetical protein n=1 Tax=Cephaloticoccus sp. TaxID=1985742 RepID=UPI00404A47CD